MTPGAQTLVGILMGSKSDWETMANAAKALDALGISYEVNVMSAHRTPTLVDEYVTGAEGRGLLSFPKPGISLALDLPYRGERTQRLIDRLNEIVIAAGGRVYLTKDALTRREHFLAMEPRFPRWNEIRRKWDPDGRLRSAQSIRLFGDAP